VLETFDRHREGDFFVADPEFLRSKQQDAGQEVSAGIGM
jgi:hypothetical protein